jgi:hypothetical protein
MKKDYVKEAAQAHSNLNIWAAVQALMEHSLLYGGHAQKAESKVVEIAKREQQKEFKRYEKARRDVYNGQEDLVSIGDTVDARYWECEACKKQNDIFHPAPELFAPTMKALLSGDGIGANCRHCDHAQIIKLEGQLIAVRS